MAEAPKTEQPIEEKLTLAKKSLADSLGVKIDDPAVTKASDVLNAVAKEAHTGAVAKAGITQESLDSLVKEIHDQQKNGANAETIALEAKINFMGNAADKIGEEIKPIIEKAKVADEAFGGKPGAYQAAVEQHGEALGKQQMVKSLPSAVEATHNMAETLKKSAAEDERLIKSVGQEKIDTMKPEAASIVDGNELKSAVDLRHTHAKHVTTAAEAEKAGTKMTEETKKVIQEADKAAAEAEKAANGLFAKLRGAHAAGDAQKAFDRVVQTAIDNSRETNPEMHAQLKAIREAGVKTELGDLGKMLGKERFAASGIETELGKNLGTMAEKGGMMAGTPGRIAMGVAGAAVAGLAVKAALADKPVDPQTNEKPKMSFGGKVATALAAVVGAGLVVAAVRGGNPVQGLKEGEGVVGKFTAMLHSAAKTGAYAGRA